VAPRQALARIDQWYGQETGRLLRRSFRTGRYLDYRSVTGPDGMEKGDPILYPYGNGAGKLEVFRGWLYSSLLMSIRAAFSLPDDGRGMGDYDQSYQNQYSVPDGRKPLPHLT
jgi:hypothetical protein